MIHYFSCLLPKGGQRSESAHSASCRVVKDCLAQYHLSSVDTDNVCGLTVSHCCSTNQLRFMHPHDSFTFDLAELLHTRHRFSLNQGISLWVCFHSTTIFPLIAKCINTRQMTTHHSVSTRPKENRHNPIKH